MKQAGLLSGVLSVEMVEAVAWIWRKWRRQRLPLGIFVLLCLNLVVAPAVYAAASGTLERRQVWAIGVLILLTVVLAGYLFVVVFQPERF